MFYLSKYSLAIYHNFFILVITFYNLETHLRKDMKYTTGVSAFFPDHTSARLTRKVVLKNDAAFFPLFIQIKNHHRTRKNNPKKD